MEDDLAPQIIDVSEPTAEEISINMQIEEIRRRHMEELEPYFKRATSARMRRQPKYAVIPPKGKTSFELDMCHE